MTAGLLNCPTDETLAAFIDGRLDEGARQNMVRHLADCAECRDVVLMAGDIAAAGVVERTDNVVRGRFRSRMIPVMAAAAAVVVLFLITPVRERILGNGTGMGALADAAETIGQRPTEARLNTGFDYKPPPKRLRGGKDSPFDPLEHIDSRDLGVAVVEAKLEEARRKRELSARELHVLGVAKLLQKSKSREAVQTLEKAVMRAIGTSDVPRAIAASEDAALLTDLVAAYLARGDIEDQAAAFGAAQRAWSVEQSPTTAWNRAVTMEKRNPRVALAAWDDYVRLDPSSSWTEEASNRKEDLRAQIAPE